VHLLPGLQSVRARIYRPWLERRDGAAARAIAEGLCRRYPDVLWLRAEAAYLAHLLDRQDSAYRDYAAVLRHGFIGDHPLIFFAEAAAKTGRVAEAIAALERSKVIYPDQIPEADRMLALGWAMRAQALIAARKPDEALAAGRRAVAHGPDQPASHAAVAHALLALGRLDEAAALYREILARWPLDPQAASVGRANLGWILRARAERARRTR
jgi:tetratricopeptide (TPR) repeat protein